MVILLAHYFTNEDNLKSELKELNYTLKSDNFTFFSDNGVFSKERIDFGSNALIENVLEDEKRNHLKVLDLGCGYGLIGIVLNKMIQAEVTMSDVNKRALHLTERNLKLNNAIAKVVESDCYENIEGKFDLIVTNPPIRAGKDVLLKMLLGSSDYLTDKGLLWFVMKKDHGAKSMIRELSEKFECTVVEKRKGFYIIKAKIH